MAKEHEQLLQTLFGSAAYDKVREGRRQELTFADACRFWSVSDNLSGEALDTRLDRQRAELADIERRVSLGSAVLSDGRCVTLDEVGQLSALYNHLLERFGRHLTLLRNRAVRS